MSEDNVIRLPRLRTMKDAVEEIRRLDPGTAVSFNFVRCLVVSGKVPRLKSGKKYMVDVDLLIRYIRENAQFSQET